MYIHKLKNPCLFSPSNFRFVHKLASISAESICPSFRIRVERWIMTEMAYFRSESYFSSPLSRINNLFETYSFLLPVFSSSSSVSFRNEKSTANRILRNVVWNRSNIYVTPRCFKWFEICGKIRWKFRTFAKLIDPKSWICWLNEFITNLFGKNVIILWNEYLKNLNNYFNM